MLAEACLALKAVRFEDLEDVDERSVLKLPWLYSVSVRE